MLHIILLILKVLLLALVVLLGLVILLGMTVLFVPVRYRGWLKAENGVSGRLKISWLCSAASVCYIYEMGKGRTVVRLFGIPLERLQKLFGWLGKVVKRIRPGNYLGRKRNRRSQKESLTTAQVSGREHTGGEEGEEACKGAAEGEKVNAKSASEAVPDMRSKDNPEAVRDLSSESESGRESAGNAKKRQQEPGGKASKEEFSLRCGRRTGRTAKGPLGKLIAGIKGILQALWRIPSKIKGMLAGIRSFGEALRRLFQRGGIVRAFLIAEENRPGLTRMVSSFWGILRKSQPKKIRGYLRFGLEDPADTGLLLAAAAAAYGRYGDSVQILPDFEQKILEGELEIQGSLRFGAALRMVAALLTHKDFKTLAKNFNQMKEEW